jgi:hypothetical protein
MKLPNFLVLIPYSRGYQLFIRTGADKPSCVLDSNSPREIFDAVAQLEPPRLVAHVGRAYDHYVANLVLHETDLCIIPEPWLRHLSILQPRERARFAAQLVEAHLTGPIRLYGDKDAHRLPIERNYLL